MKRSAIELVREGSTCDRAPMMVQGTPEDIAASEVSHTGRFLREVLARRPLRAPKRQAAE